MGASPQIRHAGSLLFLGKRFKVESVETSTRLVRAQGFRRGVLRTTTAYTIGAFFMTAPPLQHVCFSPAFFQLPYKR